MTIKFIQTRKYLFHSLAVNFAVLTLADARKLYAIATERAKKNIF